jgi:hypothetical protein
LSVAARKAVVDLNLPAAPVGDDQTLVVAKDTWAATRLFLERRAPAGPDDTGWYLAPAPTTGIIAINTVPVRDLLEVRPDFRELLVLPEGHLLVLAADGIRSVFTPAGDDLWRATPGSAEKAP